MHILSLFLVGALCLCTGEASSLWLSKRDKTADIEATIAAGRIILKNANDAELKQMKDDFKKCLASPNQNFIKSVPLQVGSEMKLRDLDDVQDILRRFFREKRSYYDHLYKRDRNQDIEDILASGRKLLNEMTPEEVKKVEFIDKELDSLSPEKQRKYLDLFNQLADKCTKRRRAFQLESNSDEE